MAQGTLILDRYEPLGTAGTGGFGTVQIAWDPRIQRKVAIKTIRLTELDAYRANLPGAQSAVANSTEQGGQPHEQALPTFPSTAGRWHGALPWNEFLAEQDKRERVEDEEPSDIAADVDAFDPVTSLAHLPGLDEARTAAMLDDPRIVTVYDFEIRERTAYLIMEYVEGITLTRLLVDYADDITLAMVTAVFDAVAGALMTAHKANVLHLDIKPDNIIITPNGQAKVTDFGLATLADASGAGTTGGGTIGYMPLEQMRREHLDARTDEWSLASLTYEMLTGENPFRAPNLAEAEAAIENAELVLPSLCWDDVDEQIDDVIFYALDPDREERYASVEDFAEEMDKFLGDAELGREHLSWAVSDALGLLSVEPDEESDATPADETIAERPRKGSALSKLFSSLVTPAPPREPNEDDYYGDEVDYDDEDDYVEEPPSKKKKTREKKPHTPLRDRYSDRIVAAAGRAFAIVASAALTFLSIMNIPLLETLGNGIFVAAAVFAVACAIAAMIRPHIGTLASYCLFGLSLAICGHPIIAALIIVAAAAWWYTIGHEGIAEANTALMLPFVDSIGGAAATPLVIGATLKPIPAIGTAVFAAFVALVFASFGSNSLLGWAVFDNWNYANADVTGNLLALVQQPRTWIILASWIAASAVSSLLKSRDNRFFTFIGIIASAVIVFSVAFFLYGPDPQLVISIVAAAVALLVVYL